MPTAVEHSNVTIKLSPWLKKSDLCISSVSIRDTPTDANLQTKSWLLVMVTKPGQTKREPQNMQHFDCLLLMFPSRGFSVES